MNYLAATINNPVLGPDLQALNGTTFVQKLVPATITFGLVIGILIFFFNLIIGGVMWINSGGDKGQTEAAKSKVTNALIGIVVLFLAFVVLQIAGAFLGTDLTSFNLNSLKIK
jgi:thiamine transporter ThiT